MKYGDEKYQRLLRSAKLEYPSVYDEALLAAEAECEELRATLKAYHLATEKGDDLRRQYLKEYRARYGNINHVEQEETK